MGTLSPPPVGAKVTHLVLLGYLGLLEVIPTLSKLFHCNRSRIRVKIVEKHQNLAHIPARYVSDYPMVGLKNA